MSQIQQGAKLLLVDDDTSLTELLAIRLESNGYEVEVAHRGTQALNILKQMPIDLVITDLKMAHMNGFELNEQIKKHYTGMPVVMMTAHGSIPDAVDAMQQGFVSFLTKPIDSQQMLDVINEALAGKVRTAQTSDPNSFHGLLFQSASMRQLVQQLQALASSNANILIQGESGTGKEVTAKAIHLASNQSQGPFIAINCGAMPAHLLESELFGHKKGAFTGAVSDKEGLVQAADGGTLFLDEIGDMPLDLQVKLLRVLQERTVRPVGGQSEYKVNVRFVSASHKNIQTAVAEKQFREDLYYRLNVVSVEIPSLRERLEDIPLLASRFLSALSDGEKQFNQQSITHLLNYHWPGNIRQLHNIVEHCVAITPGKVITEDIVQKALPKDCAQNAFTGLNEAKRQFEYDYIQKVLALCEGNVSEAAKLAQRNRSDFYKLLKKHEIQC
ncbi:sigma-54-dependent transcriptional regulator [Pseudoalteromonas peptidolytica]|uniref:Two-component system, NtrC family, response regulator GlrR n=1 Tax=Pseudoalteromonas peptidolytica F12-50-A1 TaxID=1315280 RepID=A0A8I0N2A7_9GAMM|nr:sigma-54 dependent transcriptional regulator [Pseudoalteromonas peptidolytica]MBE0349259.1 two-component system, NtrC family, response regulator GlrR [Pseudoalteromonas peptidolytica F12-50-A1]NLR16474.1 sigma-54-dependent Fis family transcriptional regulator [Pseudoalteromonas peptidolytica]GEK09824.1 transcriptional regulatory protein GlrR [Pseudoalteromonas peptidolytica]